MIQAIPTKFDGWSFRSRTEARSGTPEPHRHPLAITPRGMHPADVWTFDAPASAYLAAREAQFERGPTVAAVERSIRDLYGPPRRRPI